jgi:hypothetical protein
LLTETHIEGDNRYIDYLVFRRVGTHDAKLPWNNFCLRYAPLNYNILMTANNQYIDYHPQYVFLLTNF